jgi:hypothetical protein
MPVMTAMPAARPDGRAIFDALMVEKRIVIREPYPKHDRGRVEANGLSRPNALRSQRLLASESVVAVQ